MKKIVAHIKNIYFDTRERLVVSAVALGILLVPWMNASAITTDMPWQSVGLQATTNKPATADGLPTLDTTGIGKAEPFYTLPTQLPEAVVKTLGSNTPLVIRDQEKNFQFTIPFRVQGVTIKDSLPSSTVRALRTYTGQIITKGRDNISLSVIAGDNKPEDGSSLAEWNSTWYGVPIKNMSKETFLDIWKKNMSAEQLKFPFDGNLITGPEIISGYWLETSYPPHTQDEAGNAVQGSAKSLVQVDLMTSFVASGDPKMQYAISASFEKNNTNDMRSIMSNKVIPSFTWIAPALPTMGNQKIIKDRHIYSLVVSKGFSFKETAAGQYALQHKGILWEVALFDMPTPWVSDTAVLMTKVATVGDQYIGALTADTGVSKAKIDGYYYLLEQKEIGFVIYGTMYSETLQRVAPFVTYSRLTHDNMWIVSRVFYDTTGNDAQNQALIIAKGVREKI